MNLSIIYALAAAALFGASTPLAKSLGLGLSPILLAGLLYLGSGIGLAGVRLIRDRGWKPTGLTPSEWPWLLGAIAFGGIFGPVALMFGLTRTTSASASLMLNLESVLSAVIAWVVFRENATDASSSACLPLCWAAWCCRGPVLTAATRTGPDRSPSRWRVCAGALITT